jgi:peptide methionine sulfoxide reductase msrA/msrB
LATSKPGAEPLKSGDLNPARQLVAFEAEHCEFCERFEKDIMSHWQAEVPIARTLNSNPPSGWNLQKPLFAAPTIVLFKNGKEVARYTGYNGEKSNFWKWLGFQLLSSEQQKIAFKQGTEPPFTASNLDEKRPEDLSTLSRAQPSFTAIANLKAERDGPVSLNPWKAPLPCTKTTLMA